MIIIFLNFLTKSIKCEVGVHL